MSKLSVVASLNLTGVGDGLLLGLSSHRLVPSITVLRRCLVQFSQHKMDRNREATAEKQTVSSQQASDNEGRVNMPEQVGITR